MSPCTMPVGCPYRAVQRRSSSCHEDKNTPLIFQPHVPIPAHDNPGKGRTSCAHPIDISCYIDTITGITRFVFTSWGPLWQIRPNVRE